MDDLSPEGINRAHGKPTWRCWSCKATTGLHWHNGWSVAVCNDPACASAYNAMIAEQLTAEASFEAYVKENFG